MVKNALSIETTVGNMTVCDALTYGYWDQPTMLACSLSWSSLCYSLNFTKPFLFKNQNSRFKNQIPQSSSLIL